MATSSVRELLCAHQALRDGMFVKPGLADIAVVGAVSGCGTTTTALAIAESLGRPCRVVEITSPFRSGLAAASAAEMGLIGRWQIGSRGEVRLERGTGHLLNSSLPTIVDLGQWPVSPQAEVVVVVMPPTEPGLRRTGAIVDELAEHPDLHIVVVGATRWPRWLPTPSWHPAFADRIHYIPRNRGLERRGLTSAPLPSTIRLAAIAREKAP